MDKTGVYETTKKDGTKYYRVSVTVNGKHISLGSYDLKSNAVRAYKAAKHLLETLDSFADYKKYDSLNFDKFVVLLNLRDNKIYFSSPVYLKNRFFYYYLDEDTALIFDKEDLFYYTEHKIMRRGGHLFVNDFGMQYSLLSRYGVRPYSVLNRDYRFVNGNSFDFRRENIEVINPYIGVTEITEHNKTKYLVKIHVKGNYTVGTYNTIEEAAIAYNKAADTLRQKGIKKEYGVNYLDGISPSEYAAIYSKISISPSI